MLISAEKAKSCKTFPNFLTFATNGKIPPSIVREMRGEREKGQSHPNPESIENRRNSCFIFQKEVFLKIDIYVDASLNRRPIDY